MNPTIRQIACRQAADILTRSLDWPMPLEIVNARIEVRKEYDEEIKKIAASLYRRAGRKAA